MNTLQQQPGLVCPQCSYKISISINQLLSFSKIVCPVCGLALSLDQTKSKPAIEALRTFNEKLNTSK